VALPTRMLLAKLGRRFHDSSLFCAMNTKYGHRTVREMREANRGECEARLFQPSLPSSRPPGQLHCLRQTELQKQCPNLA
jgi:hypothetical protein